MYNLAPITLFVYNRPEHTHRTVEALLANKLAASSDLIVYADGPKENASEPSPLSAYNGFFGCRHFSKANEFLRQNGLDEIDWHID